MTAAVPETPASIEVTHEPEIPVQLVQLWLCDPCLDGDGEQCHTPGCSLWIHNVPRPALRGSQGVTILGPALEPFMTREDFAARQRTGQAEYETWRAAVPDVACNVPGGAWEDLPATVQAGFDAIAARQSQPAAEQAADRIVRDVLESLCRRDGLSLESTLVPGEPARNYALAERLGIGHVFGLPDVPQPAPGEIRTCYCGTTATVVPGAFPHPDCDGSVQAEPQPVAALASLADEMDREAAALRAAGAQLGGHGREVREYAALAHEDDARRVRKLTAREPGPVARTPALARPGPGAVLVLAVGTGADDSSVQALEKAVKGATEGEGVTVVTVRGVEALRTWEPQPAPGLAHTREDVIASYNAGYVAAVEKHGAPGLAAAKADAEQARDALSAVMTENRQRSELLGEIGALAANADDDENCFAVCEEIAMRIAAAGVPDGGLPS